MACKMALVDEADMVCSFADGELACGQKFLRFSRPGPLANLTEKQ
jgi:hypothetical protein